MYDHAVFGDLQLLRWVVTAVAAVLGLVTAAHALLNKRDPRAAVGWMALCLVVPFVGPLTYLILGVNRIRTRGRKIGRRRRPLAASTAHTVRDDGSSANRGPSVPEAYSELAKISSAVSRRPLVGGNHVVPLVNGEQAYPPMLDAIRNARERVWVETYIFETNPIGMEFVDALVDAHRRGVDVRVLVDGLGERYARPRVTRLLRKHGVPAKRFLPPRLFPPQFHINLRTHRKALVVDGEIAFTGGMNIGGRHLVDDPDNDIPTQDIHFELRGPVIHQLEQLFLEDWCFTTGEPAPDIGEPPPPVGDMLCRTVAAGPNEDFERITAILVGAVSAARKCVYIVTPYFLPPRELISALQAASLRGVDVEIILPGENNLPYVEWAATNGLWELLQRGVRVFFQPPPFAHTKLFVVDDHYLQFGSANLDPRSLRLNFELVVELFSPDVGRIAGDHFRALRDRSRETSLSEVDERSLPVRLRDAFCWLFTPYL